LDDRLAPSRVSDGPKDPALSAIPRTSSPPALSRSDAVIERTPSTSSIDVGPDPSQPQHPAVVTDSTQQQVDSDDEDGNSTILGSSGHLIPTPPSTSTSLHHNMRSVTPSANSTLLNTPLGPQSDTVVSTSSTPPGTTYVGSQERLVPHDPNDRQDRVTLWLSGHDGGDASDLYSVV
jgi:hypothetical protein